MKKIIKKVPLILLTIFMVWITASILEVVANNFVGDSSWLSPINIFQVIG